MHERRIRLFSALLLMALALGASLARAQQEEASGGEKGTEYKATRTPISISAACSRSCVHPTAKPARSVGAPEPATIRSVATLGGLQPEYAQEALDLMNRARADEERGNERSALKDYKRVFKDYAGQSSTPRKPATGPA